MFGNRERQQTLQITKSDEKENDISTFTDWFNIF